MEGERCGGHSELGRDVPDAKAFRPLLHEQPENGEARVLGQGGEAGDRGL